MTGRWLRIGFTLLVTLAFQSGVQGEDGKSLAALPMEQVLSGLTDSDFNTRRAAQLELAHRGEQNPELLEKRIMTASPEEGVRLMRLLEGVFLKYADARGDRAEHALERIRRSSNPLAVEAETILLEHWRLRESRARAAIEKLGGTFVYKTYDDPELRGRRIMLEQPTDDVPRLPALFGIWLHEDWKGTREDLWHLARLSHAASLHLYSIRGNNVEVDDLLALAGTLRDLRVEPRGPCLGVRNDPTTPACVVYEVVRQSPAALAGIEPRDEIIAINETPLTSFHQLVQALREYNHGDTVKLKVRRGPRELVIPVTLDSWRKSLAADEQFVPAPPLFLGPLGTEMEAPAPPPSTGDRPATSSAK